MAGIPNYIFPDPRQRAGTEYGGIQPTLAGGIQPKGEDALTNSEKLRLGYVTGAEADTRRDQNLDDHRQMLGLKPADPHSRPVWLDQVNDEDDPRLESEARRQGYKSG